MSTPVGRSGASSDGGHDPVTISAAAVREGCDHRDSLGRVVHRHLVPRQWPLHAGIGEHEVGWIGVAGEPDIDLLPDPAVHAVCSDDTAGTHGASFTLGVSEVDVRARAVLADAANGVRAVDVRACRSESRQQHGLGDVLRHHEGVGMGRRQLVEQHRGQQSFAIADGEPRDHQTTFTQLLAHAELIENLQGARVHDTCA